MQGTPLVRIVAVVTVAFVAGEGSTVAQEHATKNPTADSKVPHPFSLSLASVYTVDPGADGSNLALLLSDDLGSPVGGSKSHDYREISDFFNVREANVNTVVGEWELELEGDWVTGATKDDDFTFTPNIKYGLTDDMFIELEVRPLVIGDGGDQGDGDTSIQLFYQIARETDALPALATWIEARIPTGEGSSGVDGELHFNLSKTLMPRVRGHFEGFVLTANGGRGDEGADRRSFQWAAGVGLDYQIDDLTICTVNYLNRSSEDYGNANQQILEIGGVRKIAENQHLKLAFDIGLGGEETRDFGVKLLWSLEW